MSKENEFIALIDAYAEARHAHGDYTYNATTRAARDALIDAFAKAVANMGGMPLDMTPVGFARIMSSEPFLAIEDWRGGLPDGRHPLYTAEQVQAALDAASQPKAALPLTPITSFVAAAAFASEPFTDDTFAAFQQGVRFAERVHGVSNGTE